MNIEEHRNFAKAYFKDEKLGLFNGSQEKYNSFKELISKYSYNQYIGEIAFELFRESNAMKANKEKSDNCLELVKLAELLNKCEGNSITIKGTISNPSNGEIKGQEKSITINLNNFRNDYIRPILEEQFDYLLGLEGIKEKNEINSSERRLQNDYYEYTIEKNKPFIKPHFFATKYLIPKERFPSLINKVKSSQSHIPQRESAKIGYTFLYWRNIFSDYGMFKTEYEAERKTGIVTEYAFLYDCAIFIEYIGYDTTITDKEKYTFVKDKIKAWTIFESRID